MSLFEAIIAVIFIGWLIINILYAVFNSRLGSFTWRWDPFRWISVYQLFSATSRDFLLSYRDRLADGRETEWQIISYFPPQKWFQTIWFPESLIGKTVHSFVDDIVRFQESEKDNSAIRPISERFFYRFVCLYIKRFPASENAVARQFKIEEINGFTLTGESKSRTVCISEFNI